ncbi:glycosyltransferase family 4 protein [Actinocorallia longicatena]|uniref:Glycosyltransferase n=1 Tax=Actinocorallia longicatena TaxID=111803 RepID=A0ABP6QHC4_9ACTN
MKILVLPRDANPYQSLLYGAMRGVEVRYLGESTPSRTLNQLLIPLELAAGRARGARIVHLHWTFGFGMPSRRLAWLWFRWTLTVIRLLGLRLVWTAHNVLPHGRVFPDDAAARRLLVRACDLVIAHGPRALDGLAGLGAVPARSALVPHGAYSVRDPGPPPGRASFLYFGQIAPYKGVEDLIEAFEATDLDATLTIAGNCRDRAHAERLETMAARSSGRLRLNLGYVPDDQVSGYFAEADAVVLPFRNVTTSGSTLLALSHGRPVLLPAGVGLWPDAGRAVMTYDGTVPGLSRALRDLAAAPDLADRATAARAHAGALGWDAIGATTRELLTALIEGRS